MPLPYSTGGNMKIVVKERVTLEGFTYQPGEHEVEDRIGEKLMHNWPDRVALKPKRKARVAKPKAKTGASRPDKK